jgi:hypothetical protein
MLETALNVFLTFFGVIAALVGSLGVVIGLWLWAPAEFLGKPLKVNGTDGPLNWPKRILLAVFVVGFTSLAAFGLWLTLDDWLANCLASAFSAVPWWGAPGWLILCWLVAVLLLSRFSSWRELSKVYPKPSGQALVSRKLPWAVMGDGVTFKNVLTISAYHDGLGVSQNRFFGPFNRPVLVPWKSLSVENVDGAKPALSKLSFGEAELVQLTLLDECWQSIERYKPSA